MTGFRPGRRVLGAAGLLMLLTFGSASTAAAAPAWTPHAAEARAAIHPANAWSVRDSRDYVFSEGTIIGVGSHVVTIRAEDGQMESYTLDDATTIQTQDGDAQRLADLKVGNAALVLSVENTSTAVTIVNGGDAGFHEAGPADMRGDDEACAPCDAPNP